MERRNKAFTLIELLVVIAIIALLIGILLPALAKAKLTAKNVLSQANMSQLNVGSATYSADNRDLIPTYSWRAGKVVTFCDGKTQTATDDTDAAGKQAQDILMRATGRCTTDTKFRRIDILPHRRYNHLVLLDYLTDKQPEQIAASPFDANLLQWQENPDDISVANNIPYMGPVDSGYDSSSNFRRPGVKQLWPFASSYQTVPAAWNTDGIGGQATYIPIASTPHLFQGTAGVQLGRRKYLQVAYPSMKVYMFEEFDRFTDREGLYFAYPESRNNLQFFDGSVRTERTGDANPGWNPSAPNTVWRQRYIPLHTFPLPKGGFDETTTYCQRYRWTRHGLQGIDFGGNEIGLSAVGLDPSTTFDCGS